MANSFASKCTCNYDYKCSDHRRKLLAWAVQFSSGKKILIERSENGVSATFSYSVEEAEQLVIDIQRAIKAY